MTANDILGFAALLGFLGVLWFIFYAATLTMIEEKPATTPAAAPAPEQPQQEEAADTTGLPANTLIEIGDAAFTPEEASRIISLADWYAGKQVTRPTWRGGNRDGDGGSAA